MKHTLFLCFLFMSVCACWPKLYTMDPPSDNLKKVEPVPEPEPDQVFSNTTEARPIIPSFQVGVTYSLDYILTQLLTSITPLKSSRTLSWITAGLAYLLSALISSCFKNYLETMGVRYSYNRSKELSNRFVKLFISIENIIVNGIWRKLCNGIGIVVEGIPHSISCISCLIFEAGNNILR